MNMYEQEAFPQGVVVFFRQITADGNMARSVLLNGRSVVMLGGRSGVACHEDDYVVLDKDGKFLGCFPRDYVSAILPVETVGTGPESNASNPTNVSQH